MADLIGAVKAEAPLPTLLHLCAVVRYGLPTALDGAVPRLHSEGARYR